MGWSRGTGTLTLFVTCIHFLEIAVSDVTIEEKGRNETRNADVKNYFFVKIFTELTTPLHLPTSHVQHLLAFQPCDTSPPFETVALPSASNKPPQQHMHKRCEKRERSKWTSSPSLLIFLLCKLIRLCVVTSAPCSQSTSTASATTTAAPSRSCHRPPLKIQDLQQPRDHPLLHPLDLPPNQFLPQFRSLSSSQTTLHHTDWSASCGRQSHDRRHRHERGPSTDQERAHATACTSASATK